MTHQSTRREENNAKAFEILILIIIMYVACHGIISCLNAVELLPIITGRQLFEDLRNSEYIHDMGTFVPPCVLIIMFTENIKYLE